MHNCQAKDTSAEEPSCSLVGWPTLQHQSVRVLSTGGAHALFLSTLSIAAFGAILGALRLRMMARNNNQDEFASSENNVLFVDKIWTNGNWGSPSRQTQCCCCVPDLRQN